MFSKIDFTSKLNLRRALMVIVGNILLGAGVGIFKLSMLGNDPFDGMNMALADVTKISYPVFQMMVNLVFLIIQFFVKPELIGFGTIVNSIGVGYVAAFVYDTGFKFVGEPEQFWFRIVILMVGMIIASLGLSLYQKADLGVAPYDSFALAMDDKIKKLPYMICRIITDSTCALICFLAGGIVGIGTLVTAFGFGPFISFFNKTVSDPILSREKS
ncbi:MAG: hypothetical protein K6F00_05475 [Lachnospiraceae bacterium]|nr:hypothetical protein [Lachnospiraceae bacterium]